MLFKLFVFLIAFLFLPQMSLAAEEYWEKGLTLPSKTIKPPAGLPSVFDKDTKGSGTDTQSVKLAVRGPDDLAVLVMTGFNNQPLKIFKQAGKIYLPILNDIAAEWYPIAEVVNGRHSVVLRQHNTAAESDYLIYRFNGKKYALFKEFNVVYSDDTHRTIKAVPVK
jgi:hypothetical protein